MDELTKEFLVESFDGLDRMERCLTELETNPKDRELLAEIFRSVHTIKGTTGFLALPRLEKLAHAGEHLLGLLRDGKLQITRKMIDTLLALLDGLRKVMTLIEATGREGNRGEDEDSKLLALLEEMQDGNDALTPFRKGKTATPAADLSLDIARASQIDHTLRVEVDTLDRMMNLVGELVLARNQIQEAAGMEEGFREFARRLDGVTADLRETVMRARTQPVEQIFQKFPRMVRDLAQSCGRCVRLEYFGQDTRLDKSLVDALKDPLTHAIRNAVDHGIETPGERLRNGKAIEGLVRLSAHHEGGQVVIEVSDDGGGIDKDRVMERAIACGLISTEQSCAMSDQEILQLVFLPGFSTCSEVTLVSGRGVGMDVVRANVESVGGVVELTSTLGIGTTLRMRVPLTLAIVPALVVRCGEESLAIPQSAVSELLLVYKKDEQEMVQKLGSAPMLRLREELLPLVSLSDLLRLPEQVENGYYVAVLESKGIRFGLVVDDLLDPQEIVVKPLPKVLRSSGVFSGASILGNGKFALILDIGGVLARAGLVVTEERVASHKSAVIKLQEAPKIDPMLVFEAVSGERRALALADVERIECVDRGAVEYCSGQALTPYDGGFLPLEDPDGLLKQPELVAVNVVVWRNGKQGSDRIGMVVRQVLDIAEAQELPKHSAHRGRLALVDKHLANVYDSYGSLKEAA